jgi:hypothetical protein
VVIGVRGGQRLARHLAGPEAELQPAGGGVGVAGAFATGIGFVGEETKWVTEWIASSEVARKSSNEITGSNQGL